MAGPSTVRGPAPETRASTSQGSAWASVRRVMASAPRHRGHGLRQAVEPAFHVGSEVETQHSSLVPSEHLVVPERLRFLQRAEAEALAGNRPIPFVRDELQEYAAIGAALVELTGRMEKARAVAER